MKRKAVYINLESRGDRRKHAEEQIAGSRVLREWGMTRFEAFGPETCVRPTWYCQTHGFWASRRSHMAVIEQALLERVDELLVMEDDAVLQSEDLPGMPVTFDDTYRHVRTVLPEEWMGVQFGGYHVSPPTPVKAGLVRLWRFFECPMALYSRRGMEVVWDYANSKPNMVFDWYLMELYHAYPWFFAPDVLPVRQIAGWSNNEEKIRR